MVKVPSLYRSTCRPDANSNLFWAVYVSEQFSEREESENDKNNHKMVENKHGEYPKHLTETDFPLAEGLPFLASCR